MHPERIEIITQSGDKLTARVLKWVGDMAVALVGTFPIWIRLPREKD